jgi:hypothetical protein
MKVTEPQTSRVMQSLNYLKFETQQQETCYDTKIDRGHH